MKVLLINKFHFLFGGTETFHYNLAEALIAAGHEVVFFSMYDERNIPCEQDKYFVSKVDYNDPNLRGIKKVRTGLKLIYSFEAKKNIEKLLREEKPDVAHIGLLHRQLTFSVVDALVKYNIPIVMHQHDLTAICPCYTMLLPNGEICDKECLKYGFHKCIKHKCMKNSILKSILGFIEAKFLNNFGYYNKIDLYIAECKFYQKQLEDAHFTKSPIIHMNNFLPTSQEFKPYYDVEDYILYFGRYSREKGILTALEAYKRLNCQEKLVLVGRGSEEEKIKEYIKINQLEDRVEFNGAIFGEKMERIIEKAKVILIPSEWYENCPYVALQSIAKGKIVVASDVAGLSEIFENGETGFLAEMKNPDSFAKAISNVLKMSKDDYKKMSIRICEYAKRRCNVDNYIHSLISEYQKLLDEKKIRGTK